MTWLHTLRMSFCSTDGVPYAWWAGLPKATGREALNWASNLILPTVHLSFPFHALWLKDFPGPHHILPGSNHHAGSYVRGWTHTATMSHRGRSSHSISNGKMKIKTVKRIASGDGSQCFPEPMLALCPVVQTKNALSLEDSSAIRQVHKPCRSN